jgi:hypothetical protein
MGKPKKCRESCPSYVFVEGSRTGACNLLGLLNGPNRITPGDKCGVYIGDVRGLLGYFFGCLKGAEEVWDGRYPNKESRHRRVEQVFLNKED